MSQGEVRRLFAAMIISASRIRLIAIAGLAALLTAALPRQGQAAQTDFADCTAQQYDRVRTEGEIAATIAACTNVLQDKSASSEQRAYAFYFRALNHFLDATRLAIAERKPVGAADASRREVNSALEDLASCIATAPAPDPHPFSLRATIETVLERFDGALDDLEHAIRASSSNG